MTKKRNRLLLRLSMEALETRAMLATGPELWVNSYGNDVSAGAWHVDQHPRMMADVNADGKDDVVGFGIDGTYVSLSTGSSFKAPELWVNSYGYEVSAGAWRVDQHPRMMADVNADGNADVVGFGVDGTYVSLSTGSSFKAPELWVNSYGYDASAGAWRIDQHLRMMADVNADGKDDVVGFGVDGTYVSLSTGSSFKAPELWVNSYGYEVSAGSWRVELHHRMTADVNADGKDDVVGFGVDGTYVSLSTGSSFKAPELWVNSYGYEVSAGAWRVDQHPRMMADVNADGRDDVVGFGIDGTYVSLSTGSSFKAPELWVNSYGYEVSAGAWRVDQHPRMMADMNADGKDDVVGFGIDGTYVSLSTGSSFKAPKLWVNSYGYGVSAGSWRVDLHPRMMADVNADGKDDVVGFGIDGTYVSLSTTGKAPELWVNNYGNDVSAGAWRVDQHSRMMADVNADGRDDVVGFGIDGTYVSLSTGSSFKAPELWVRSYGYDVTAGAWRIDQHLRMMADVNADGNADVVGFGVDGTYVSLSTGSSFKAPELWVNTYGYGVSAGAWRIDQHLRMMADVNADGNADVVGFGIDGTYVSLSTGSSFTAPELWVNRYGYDVSAGAWRVDQHPRMMADMNADGKDDVVGFGIDGTYVSLSTGSSFTAPELWVNRYGYDVSAGAWRVDKHPRMMADMNADGKDDVVGFGIDGTYVSLSTGSSFKAPELWVNSYGYEVSAGAWRVDQHPRMMADMNADGKDDVVGFGIDGTYVSLSTGSSFKAPELWANSYGYGVSAGSWRVDLHPRMMADVNADGKDDVVGFANVGTYVSLSTPISILGDINNDCVINSSDIDALYAALKSGEMDPWLDLNRDSRLNQEDVDELVEGILGSSYGDANLDGVFDSSDLVKIFQTGQYEDITPRNSNWASGDWNGDLEFTTGDLVLAFAEGRYQG